jgi:hypothetical protein
MAGDAVVRRERQANAAQGEQIMNEGAVADFVAVSKDDIAAFAAKLVQWGSTLTSKEEALLQLIVERARTLVPDDVRHEQLRAGLTAAVLSVYGGVAQAWNTADGDPGWVRIDPVWYKSGPVERGEQIDITVRITSQPAVPALPPTAPAGAAPPAAVQAPPAPVVSAAPGTPAPVAVVAPAPAGAAGTAAPAASGSKGGNAPPGAAK